ncbi:unnamed protein product [Mucor hiemalis]
MASPEKKRRLTEEGSDASINLAAPSRPPLKKRFTSLNVQPPITPAPVVAAAAAVPELEPLPPAKPPVELSDNLDSYTKDELLQHMRTSKNF